MRILIADDNENNRRLLAKQLIACGHEVVSVVNGKEALSKALENPPDLAVTDILMPEMDGYQLCMEWKLNQKLRDVPLVFYTATYTSDQDEKFARSLGIDAFLRKPVDIDLLIETINGVIEKARCGQVNKPTAANLQPVGYLSEHNKILLAKLLKKVEQLETDITQRLKAELALSESEEKFRQFFDNAQVYCYIVSPENVLLEINKSACQILGYTKEELVGREFTTIYAPECLPKLNEVVEEWRRTGICENEEMQIITRKEERRDVLVSVNSIRDKAGNTKSTVIVQKDITEIKRAQGRAVQVETLTRLNAAKSELLSNVAHELRTPLQSIKGFIETLIEPDVKWSKKQQLEFLDEANKEVDVLDRLIKDLLEVSRIESGKMRLEKQTVSLGEILESIKSRLSILTDKHVLEIKFTAQSPRMNVDKLRIAQVITNLVENATKFSPQGSVITLTAEAQDNQVNISVRDRGIGMNQETVENLFHRFYQAEKNTTAKARGTGLGLSICRGIVEAHEGKIRAESTPGKGTTFIVSLPLSTS